jgi:prepilin-type N-terminal cleavage/methylation domain-containing protein
VSLAEKNNSKGFTLVEVAIVLVIVGLIVGAVVSGEQLISGAQTNRAVAQVQGVTAAYLTYVDRYRAIPGDDPQASTLWPGAKNGNGDGLISGPLDAAPPDDPSTLLVNGTEGENLNFWWHLRLAGLINGSTDSANPAVPITNAFGGPTGIQRDAYGLRGPALCLGNVTSRLASAIDARSDDGRPDRGSIRAAPDTGGIPPAAYPATDDAYILCIAVEGSGTGPAVALFSGDDGASAPDSGGSTSGGAATSVADAGTTTGTGTTGTGSTGTSSGSTTTAGSTTSSATTSGGGSSSGGHHSWGGRWGGRGR